MRQIVKWEEKKRAPANPDAGSSANRPIQTQEARQTGQSRRRQLGKPANPNAGSSANRPIQTQAARQSGQSRRRQLGNPANPDAGSSANRPIQAQEARQTGQSRRRKLGKPANPDAGSSENRPITIQYSSVRGFLAGLDPGRSSLRRVGRGWRRFSDAGRTLVCSVLAPVLAPPPGCFGPSHCLCGNVFDYICCSRSRDVSRLSQCLWSSEMKGVCAKLETE
uniref:Uncharacterized protein n=1 Tax=Knipowitschia caucasica TaxID=637954 RepID=A0AAV2MNR6_KNICA